MIDPGWQSFQAWRLMQERPGAAPSDGLEELELTREEALRLVTGVLWALCLLLGLVTWVALLLR